MTGKKRKFKITYNSEVEPEIILSKALKSIKSQAEYPLRDGYLKSLQNESVGLFDIVFKAMGEEIINVLKEK